MDHLAFLREHLRQNEKTLKREKRFELSKEEISRLINEVTMPVLNQIAAELKPYFTEVKARGFVNRGRLLIQERRTSFLFHIYILNAYFIEIEATTVNGTWPRGKGLRIFHEYIELKNHELLTEEKILRVFNEVFTNRDDLAAKAWADYEDKEKD